MCYQRLKNKNTGQAPPPILVGGQAMVLTVVMIGGIFLSATAIAGLLIFFQLQQATDFGNSTMAIFAADGAMEEALYSFLFVNLPDCPNPPCSIEVTPFDNGAIGEAEILISPQEQINVSAVIKSFGWDPGKRTIRSLENTFFINP